MKNIFLCLIAVAALCFTSCGKNYVEEYLGDYECTMTATINTTDLGPISQNLSSNFTITQGTDDDDVVLTFTDVDLVMDGEVDENGLHIDDGRMAFTYQGASVDVTMNEANAVLNGNALSWTATGTGTVTSSLFNFSGNGTVKFDATKK